MFDVGFLHLVEKLPGVCTEGLDIFTLTLGVDRIKSQRTLTRSADTRYDNKLITGDTYIYILKIVLAGTGYLYFLGHCSLTL